MARNDKIYKGERGEKKKVIRPQEGCKGDGGRGNNASSSTSNRKPPQGGSGTAPPKEKK